MWDADCNVSYKGDTLLSIEKKIFIKKFNKNLSIIIMSDYCYNSYNNWIPFTEHHLYKSIEVHTICR
ncbi:DUF7225 domain-containing protein [Litchfieldia alkalitelluris]